MINNIFSIFDPSTGILRLNWLSLFVICYMVPMPYWTFKRRLFKFTLVSFLWFLTELKNNIKNTLSPSINLLTTIFIFITFSNIIGLLPFTFTPTSHIVVSFRLSLPIWLRVIIFISKNQSTSFFAHLVPKGSPISLSAFIVLIETIRLLIRPITLGIRLRANIIAGHLLIRLLNETSVFTPTYWFTTLPASISLMLLERSVALIQSYVFVTLCSLYLNEVN